MAVQKSYIQDTFKESVSYPEAKKSPIETTNAQSHGVIAHPIEVSKGRTLYNRTTKGQSALSKSAGYVTEDFLVRLQGTQGVKVFREMSLNDPVIGGILYQMGLRMRTAKWNIKPADSSRESKKLAEIVKLSSVDLESTPWNYIVYDMLSLLTYGWSLFEPTYKATKDGLIILNTMEFRGQTSLDSWKFDEKRIPTTFLQRPPNSGDIFEIPLNRAFHLTTTPRRNNPEGLSILRTAYRSWYFKKHIEEIEGIGIERDMAGIPHLHFDDPEFDPLATANESVIDYAEKLVTNIQKDQQQGVVTYSGMSLDILQGRAPAINVDKVIGRYEQRIALALASQFMIVAFEARGSGTVASEYNDLMLDSFDSWLAILVSLYQEQIVNKLRVYNGLSEKAKVDIQVEKISQRDKVDFAAYISRLVSNGLIIPDDNLEGYIRNQAGLPEMDKASSRDVDGALIPEEPEIDPASLIQPQLADPKQEEQEEKAKDAQIENMEKGIVDGYFEVRESQAVACDPDGVKLDESASRYAVECNGVIVNSQKFASMENAIESANKYQKLGSLTIAKSIGKRGENHVYRKLMRLY